MSDRDAVDLFILTVVMLRWRLGFGLVILAIAALLTQSGGRAPRAVADGSAVEPSPYQSDRVYLDLGGPADVTGAAVETFIYERPCGDPDSCRAGRPRADGYVWFAMLGAELIDGWGGCVGRFHAGLARGNGIGEWFFDWSGYDCAGGGLGSSLGHTLRAVPERWYTVSIERVSWNGNVGCFGAWLTDQASGVRRSAGVHCLGRAANLRGAYYATEVVEAGNGPCRTDLLGVHNRGARAQTALGWVPFARAVFDYEATCADTELRLVDRPSRYTISNRGVPRRTPPGAVGFPS